MKLDREKIDNLSAEELTQLAETYSNLAQYTQVRLYSITGDYLHNSKVKKIYQDILDSIWNKIQRNESD